MTKPRGATRKRPTHFEHIPLDVVKRIAREDVPENNNTATDDEASADPTPATTTAQSVPGRTPHRTGSVT
jgi:hypothetical protein